jgi:hypothetical protein
LRSYRLRRVLRLVLRLRWRERRPPTVGAADEFTLDADEFALDADEFALDADEFTLDADEFTLDADGITLAADEFTLEAVANGDVTIGEADDAFLVLLRTGVDGTPNNENKLVCCGFACC